MFLLRMIFFVMKKLGVMLKIVVLKLLKVFYYFWNDSDNNFVKKLTTLECPFTWKMEKILKFPSDKIKDLYHDKEDANFYPIVRFMHEIMCVYVSVQTNEDFEVIMNILKMSKKHLEDLTQRPQLGVSIKVAEYILRASQCYVYRKFNNLKELKRTLSEIENVKFTSKVEKSTLAACRSICWSSNHEVGMTEAEKFMREALAENDDYYLWYFILAKNLRRQRRYSGAISKPSDEEIRCFKTAYERSDESDPMCEVFLAQAYREDRNEKSTELYERSFYRRPDHCSILLRLARGFLRKDLIKSEHCFNKLKQQNFKNSTYCSYYATFLRQRGNYADAQEFDRKAVQLNKYNLNAHREKIKYEMMSGRSYSIIEGLRNILKIFEDYPDKVRQPLILDLALCYWVIQKDTYSAVDYFLQAIKIDHKALCFTAYYDYLNVARKLELYRNKESYVVINIFHVLKEYVFPRVDSSVKSEMTIGKANELKEYCSIH